MFRVGRGAKGATAASLLGESAGVGRRVRGGPRILTMASSASGTGKTFLAANLALDLARRGKRVGLVDLDCRGDDLHSFFQVRMPKASLLQYFQGAVELGECAREVRNRVTLYHGGAALAVDACEFRADFVDSLRLLEQDIIVIDLGSVTPAVAAELWASSRMGLLVETAEPDSWERIERFLYGVVARRLELVLGREQIAQNELAVSLAEGDPNPILGLRKRAALGDAWARAVMQSIEELRVGLVLNQLREADDLGAVSLAVRQGRLEFGFQLDVLGALGFSSRVWSRAHGNRLVAEWAPEAALVRGFEMLAGKLLGRLAKEPVPQSEWRAGCPSSVVTIS